MSTISERLLLLRGKTKQKEFARTLAINPNTLRSYENGRSSPNQELLEQICVQLSVSPEWLLLGRGPMRADPLAKNAEQEPPAPDSNPAAPASTCRQCEELRKALAGEQQERRELCAENRQLHRDKAELLREIGELRATVVRLEERAQRLAQACARGSAEPHDEKNVKK